MAVDRLLSVDLLKIVMAVFVIGIHANPFDQLGPLAITLSAEGLFRVAVPAFFVLNGYFFEPIAQAKRTRAYVWRLVLLYGLWTLLYAPGWLAIRNLDQPWPHFIRVLVMGYWQLWYLPGLALAAVLAAWLRGRPLPVILGAMGVSVLAGVAIVYAMAFDLLHPSPLYFGDMTVLHRNALFTGFPFVMAGMLIRRYHLADRISLPVAVALVALSLGFLWLETTALALHAPQRVNHDNMLSLALASPALVLLALKFPARAASGRLGVYANGLFFVHVAFCIAGYRHTDLSRVWIFAIAVAGSVLVTWVLIRTGLARRVF